MSFILPSTEEEHILLVMLCPINLMDIILVNILSLATQLVVLDTGFTGYVSFMGWIDVRNLFRLKIQSGPA
jgi:hypothetical protein